VTPKTESALLLALFVIIVLGGFFVWLTR